MRSLAAAVIVVAVALAGTPALAQAPAGRPYRGLFGGGVGTTEQSLTLTMSFSGGYQTETLKHATFLDPAAESNTLPTGHTTFQQASARLAYTLARSRVSFNASIGAGGTYYRVLNKIIAQYDGGVGASYQVSPRTGLSGSYTVAFQPLFFSGGFSPTGLAPGQLFVQPDSTGVRLSDYVTRQGQASLSHRLTERVTLSAGYGDLVATFGANDRISTQTATGQISAALTHNVSLWFSDGLFQSRSRINGVEDTTRGQQLNFGISFNRPWSLSLSRSLRLSFGVGATLVSDGHQTRPAVTGNALLTWEVGRTWTATIGYDRSVGFTRFFREPVTSDGAHASLGGLIARRVQFSSGAGWTRGAVGFHGPSNTFTTYYATAALTVGLTRNIGLGLGYTFYRSRFGAGLVLPQGLFREMDQQTVYASINLWEPLFQRARRGNATR